MTGFDPTEISMIFGWREEFIHCLIEASILLATSHEGEPIITQKNLDAFNKLVGHPPKSPMNLAL